MTAYCYAVNEKRHKSFRSYVEQKVQMGSLIEATMIIGGSKGVLATHPVSPVSFIFM